MPYPLNALFIAPLQLGQLPPPRVRLQPLSQQASNALEDLLLENAGKARNLVALQTLAQPSFTMANRAGLPGAGPLVTAGTKEALYEGKILKRHGSRCCAGVPESSQHGRAGSCSAVRLPVQ